MAARMSNKKISIEVEARVEGAARGFDKVGKAASRARKQTDKAGESLARVEKVSKKTSISATQLFTRLGIGTASVGAAVVAFDRMAERSLLVQGVMRNLAYSIDEARNRTKGLIGTFTLMQNANLLNAMGVAKTSEEFANFTEIITKLSILTGRDLAQTMDKQAAALARNSKKLADDVGIMVDASAANDAYARSINTTVQALSDEQKSMAWRAEYMRQAIELTKDVRIETESWAAVYKKTKTWAGDWWDSNLSGQKEFHAQSRISAQVSQEVLAMGLKNSEAEAKYLAEKLALYQKLGFFLKDYHAPTVEQLTNEYLRMRVSADAGYELFYRFITDSQTLTERATGAVETWIDKLKEAYEVAEAAHRRVPYAQEGYMTSPALRAMKREKRDKARKKKGRGGDRRSMLERELMDFEPGGEDAEEAWAEAFGMQGITADPFAHAERMREIEEAKAEAQLNVRMRALEEQQAAGVDPFYLLQQEQEAQLEHLDFLISEVEPGTVEHIQLIDEKRRIAHETNLKRLRLEEQAERRRLKNMQKLGQGIADTARLTGRAMALAGADNMHITGVVDAGLALSEFADAAAAAASQNYWKAAKHTASGAMYVASSIMAFQAESELGGSGGGGGRAVAPPTGATHAGDGGGGTAGGGDGGNVPRSPGAPDPPGGEPTSGGGTKEVHIHIGTLVGSDEQARVELRRMINESDHLSGSVV
jgi:hypothetical protein